MAFTGYAQLPSAKKKPSERAALLVKCLSKEHLSPPAIDDKFSAKLFKTFINSIDSRRLYFTKEDIAAFNAYKYKLDDELKGASWTFLPLVMERYKLRLTGSEKIVTDILKAPISYTQPMTYQKPDEDTLLFSGADEMITVWKKWLRYQQINFLLNNYAGKNPDSLKSATALMKYEPDTRQKMLNLEKRYIQHIVNHPEGYEEYIVSVFFGAIASQYDPHTSYFSKTEFEQFKTMLSSDEYSFGIEIDEDEAGNIIVSKLVPGGPAWKSNLVNKGDIITALRWVGKNTIELEGAEPREALYIMNSASSDKLEFSLRKANGLQNKVILKKEKIDNEENIVKGYILKGTKKVGYIALPGFYTEWESDGGSGCANDVAKEIVKLKEENIEALILDLRNNGGGSTHEALALMGIFIDEGPLFMKNDKLGKPILMKDLNRGTLYDGPLLVMINGNSASASEIVASTMQDYRRALVAGSPSFGKATEQRLINVHNGLPLTDFTIVNSPDFIGVAKVTEAKLYRITGSSNQAKGVQPDFIFPEINVGDEMTESTLPNALPNDYINKKLVYTVFDTLPLYSLKRQSELRIGQSKIFNRIKALNKEIPQSYREKKTTVTLSMEEFRKVYQKVYLWERSMDALADEKATAFSVRQNKYDKDLYEKKISENELIQKTMENIAQDYYIQESFYILNDYINIK